MHDLTNFRALPGLNRRVYRSASLDFFGRAELDYLGNALGIKTYVDLRSQGELKENALYAKQLNAYGIQWRHVPVAVMKDWAAEAQHGGFFEEYYKKILDSGQAAFKSVFHLLLDRDNLPLVIACYSGKDRTGIAAILLLSALGISKEAIATDFMSSNEAIARSIHRFEEKWIQRKVTSGTYLAQVFLPPSLPDWIIEYLDRSYGGPMAYVRRVLGIADCDLIRLKNNLIA